MEEIVEASVAAAEVESEMSSLSERVESASAGVLLLFRIEGVGARVEFLSHFCGKYLRSTSAFQTQHATTGVGRIFPGGALVHFSKVFSRGGGKSG